MNNNKPTFSKYGKLFQEKLVFFILTDRHFCDQISEVLDINFIEFKYLQAIVEELFSYKEKYESHPTLATFATLLRSGTEKYNDSVQSQMKSYYARMQTTAITEDEAYIKDTSLEFCKKQKLKEAFIKSADLLQKCSFDEISRIISEALKLGTDNDHGYDYIKDFEKRYTLKTRDAVATGWKMIDDITVGGHGKGELGVVIAPTGAGKSMHLVHLGAQALKQGKNVVHYTLELQDTVVGSRYDSCLTKIKLDKLPLRKDEVLDQIGQIEGKLLIKEYPTKSASSKTIKNHLERLRQNGFEIGLVIVDYGDLLKPISRYKEKRNELESIYEELREIAQVIGCPLWTASQTNRTGLNAEIITMGSISEAFSKCFVADLIYSVSRTMHDKTNNTGRIFIAKNRNGADGICYNMFMDTSNVSIKVLGEYDPQQTSEESIGEKYVKLLRSKKG